MNHCPAQIQGLLHFLLRFTESPIDFFVLRLHIHDKAFVIHMKAGNSLLQPVAVDLELIPDVFIRPTCKVTITTATPDLQAASAYLTIHEPPVTLAKLRTQ